MSRVTRRKFFGLVAGSAAAAALPRPVLGMAVEPAGGVILPMPVIPPEIWADYSRILYGLQYNACVGYIGAFAGIDRTQKP